MFATLNREMIPQHKITLSAMWSYGHRSLNYSELGSFFIHTGNLVNNLLNFWEVFDLVVVIPRVLLEPWIKFMKVLLLSFCHTCLIFIEDLVIVCSDKP